MNAILPGFIETAFAQRAKAKIPDFEEKARARTPAGGAASDFMSGTAIPVDGSYSVQL